MSNPISQHIWETRYRFHGNGGSADASLQDTWRRVARALAQAEPTDRAAWAERFYRLLQDFSFLPGGRILAGAGTGRRVTLFNCFVMGPVGDSLEAIFEALKEGALTMQQGGGVGYDFSGLRPLGSPARRAGSIASGPVSFMRIWDCMCATLLSSGSRRGAMMGCLRCDHPDIEAFIDAKRRPGALTHFNLSVLVSDAFMHSLAEDGDWPLRFPAEPDGKVVRVLPARVLWERLLRASYDCAEPGVLFIDRINRVNNLAYCERISATNPCGEIPLPSYGACDLGSLNLPQFVRDPFLPRARLDLPALETAAAEAVRLLDDVIDVSGYPLPQQREQALASRRIGLGITGLADALILLGLDYGSGAARALAAGAMRGICRAAYRASVALARDKGAFPRFRAGPYLQAPFVAALPVDIRRGIARFGIRNSHLLAIAPAGTISLLAGNVSSGIEPVLSFSLQRRIHGPDGRSQIHHLEDPAYRRWRELRGSAPLPPCFVTADQLAPEAHLLMQAALQPQVDSAISKTINLPAGIGFDQFRGLYERAYALGLKGCTSFRPNPVTGSLLAAEGVGAHCCSPEREGD